MGTKTLNIPDEYGFSFLNTNADIGSFTDNGNGTCEASDVDISQIKNVLNSTSNRLSFLNLDGRINRWSYFKPGKLNKSGYNVIFDLDTPPYAMGDWLGYIHDVSPPYTAKNIVQQFENTGNNNVNIILLQGQFVPSEISSSIDSIKVEVEYPVGTLYDTVNLTYSPSSTEYDFNVNLFVPASGSRTYLLKIYYAISGTKWFLFPFNSGEVEVTVSKADNPALRSPIYPYGAEPIYPMNVAPFYDNDGTIELWQGNLQYNTLSGSGNFEFDFTMTGDVYNYGGYDGDNVRLAGDCNIYYFDDSLVKRTVATNVAFYTYQNSQRVTGTFTNVANPSAKQLYIENTYFSSVA